MTDSELREHLHARGWRTEAIDVPMIREACKALAAEQNPWRQAVDEALIAHALDCTGPGDDPKEKVKELIEWAVTIATDPRVSETAAREQEASATGAEPAAYRYKDVRGHWRYVGAPLSEGWALPANLSFEPLFTYRHLREYGAIARQQGRDEMREWTVEKAAKMAEQMTMRQRLMRAAGDAKPVQPCEIAAAIRSIGTPKEQAR